MNKEEENKNNQTYDVGQIGLPDGVLIKQKQQGYCIVAARDFKKGQLILALDQFIHLPFQTKYIKMKINGKQYQCNQIHTINYGKFNYFPGSCSYMNHCCQPNSLFTKNKQKQNRLGTQLQQCYALKDIKQGQQITCNYQYFCYDEDQPQIFQCSCGSQKCYKTIRGFKHLSMSQKLELLPILYSEVKQRWLEEDKSIVLIQDMEIQESVDVVIKDNDRFEIICRKEMKQGDILFSYIPKRVTSNSTVIVKIKQKYVNINNEMIDNIQYDPVYFEYFSTFTKHSNSPNMKIICQSNKKLGKCLKDIKNGETITEDRQGSKRIQSYLLFNQVKSQDVLDIGTVVVADGVSIGKNNYGTALFAAKDFKKGQVVFQNELIFVHEHINKFKYKIGGVQYYGDQLNSVKQGDKRIIYHYAGFMNHSCEENTLSITDQQTGKINQVASRDIKAGEELTCNYLHYDPDCDGHQFICQCGSSKCFGEIKGFNNLPLEQQIKMLPYVSYEIREDFMKNHKNIVQPQSVKI